MSSASVARQFKDGMVAAAHTLWDAGKVVQVAFGQPGTLLRDDIVAFMGIATSQAPATLSSTNRSREEQLDLTVQFSCYRGGGEESEKLASDAAYGLLEELEHYLRVTDTTLGGVVRYCFLTAHTSSGFTDPTDIENGRTIEIEATFSAVARITGA